jgi:hypothetical protein
MDQALHSARVCMKNFFARGTWVKESGMRNEAVVIFRDLEVDVYYHGSTLPMCTVVGFLGVVHSDTPKMERVVEEMGSGHRPVVTKRALVVYERSDQDYEYPEDWYLMVLPFGASIPSGFTPLGIAVDDPEVPEPPSTIAGMHTSSEEALRYLLQYRLAESSPGHFFVEKIEN